ncbi:cytochrome p450 [Hirsutella rhossiliensis]|uniref:Bifunctional cytochrome P450/NADPH--P450 reductase n=1 Tax=Hirsutella rhossiliensis TaxID=111463 RepID=A0A9P8MT16_9HYPO|nr:cytochrome p450 domain-containing protein [Hirsutella rhossiliensis]KAH0958662.1 cytochrome p450 domain-containing protein [Hirsutella rhossiliensis]
MPKDIPNPEGYPILGNVLQVDAEHPHDSLARFAEIYGPIFRLRLPRERIFVANYALARDLFDEKKFQKSVSGPLEQVRNATSDGLFTAYPGEHSWEVAHRTLMPAFGPLSIRSMFGEMQDIVSQLVLKWARFGPDSPIDVSDDFTKLTLDSIALCAMGDRFNSFYRDEAHPFVKAMTGMLAESFARSRRPNIVGAFYKESNQQYRANIAALENVARGLLEERRAHPSDKKDLLNAMIAGKDPKTGEQLSDDSIIRNMITFLIAGHETTSGLLSFLFYELLENPEALKQAVDELPYLEACLRETLRLHPTAPAFTLEAKGDQVLNGEFLVKDKECVNVLLTRVHRDPDVYGPNADAFEPSRMLGENFEKLPPNAWKPFGNGVRACIGRPFAWQESLLTVATLLQTFRFTKDSHYQLQIRTALTIKPQGFYIRARPRDPELLEHIGVGAKVPSSDSAAKPAAPTASVAPKDLSPLLILYGSNTGTCEALAQSLASSAEQHGFSPEVKTMDSVTSSLTSKAPIVVVTASYEGEPPDNAAHFVQWLKSASKEEVSGVRYAVFGVGNKEWHATYQKIPIVVDETLANAGASRIVPRYAANVAQGNIFDAFDEWQDKEIWPALGKLFGKAAGGGDGANDAPKELTLEIGVQTRSKLLRQDVVTAEVCESRLLTQPGAPRKRHIGIRLPSGTSYRAGDYLAVLPLNPQDNVLRVMKRFGLPWDATITIDPTKATSLPTGQAISVHDVLSGMVELSQPVTGRMTAALAKLIPEENLAKELEGRAAKEDFQKSNVTLLDILEEYPSAAFSLGQYLAAVPPMRVRQYSISSTPLANPSECSLTYTVIDAPSKGSRLGHRFLGVASTYLERLNSGDHLQVSLRPSRSGFHLPADDACPIIMACAGTGLAPFHAFVAERALKKSGGREVGPALLFYGCNGPDEDDLYRDEFEAWEKEGVVSVRRAYTCKPEAAENCKFVQDRVLVDKKAVVDLFSKGAQVYICGAGIVGSGLEKAFAQIRAESAGCDEESALKWVQDRKGDRYWADVFA